MNSAALVVFAKHPKAGEVKTRLCPPLDANMAATFYAALLDDVLMATADVALRLGLRPYIAVYPADACKSLESRAPTGFRVFAQRGSNLAERMEAAVAVVGADCVGPVLLRSSDSPGLGEAIIREALVALEKYDLVLSPDPDGGYSLVGLRNPVRGLFRDPMSSGRVREDTLANARQQGLRARCITSSFDIDRVEDIHRLHRLPAEEVGNLCPRTMALVEHWNL